MTFVAFVATFRSDGVFGGTRLSRSRTFSAAVASSRVNGASRPARNSWTRTLNDGALFLPDFLLMSMCIPAQTSRREV